MVAETDVPCKVEGACFSCCHARQFRFGVLYSVAWAPRVVILTVYSTLRVIEFVRLCSRRVRLNVEMKQKCHNASRDGPTRGPRPYSLLLTAAPLSPHTLSYTSYDLVQGFRSDRLCRNCQHPTTLIPWLDTSCNSADGGGGVLTRDWQHPSCTAQ